MDAAKQPHEIHAMAMEKEKDHRRRQPHPPARASLRLLRASEIRIPAFLIPCSASQLMDRHYRGRVPPAARNAA